MPLHRKTSLLRSTLNLLKQPVRLLEYFQVILVGWVLLMATWHLGGAPFEGFTMVAATWGSAMLALGHGLWCLGRRGELRIQWLGLLPLPFLAWISLSLLWSSAPWFGELHVGVWWQAWLLFWVVLHVVRQRRLVNLLLGLVLSVLLVVLLTALYQFYFRPDWMPYEGLIRPAQYAQRASGVLGNPNSLAGYLLLCLPVLILGAWMKRFVVPVRMVLGTLALMTACCLVMTVSRGAYLAVVPVVLLIPFFIAERLKKRVRLLCYLVLMGLAGVTVIYFGDATVRERITQGIREGGELSRGPIWTAAVEMARAHPVMGLGAGGFHGSWEAFRQAEPRTTPYHAHNDYLEVLAEAGLVGWCLLFVPAAWFWVRLLRAWRAIPFCQTEPEQAAREARSSSSRHRRRRHHHEAPSPSAKIWLGSLVLAGLGFGLHLMVEFHLQMPAVLFLLAIWAGWAGTQIETRVSQFERPFATYLALALAGLLMVVLIRLQTAYAAQSLYREGSRALDRALEQRSELFDNAGPLGQAESYLGLAVALRPDWAPAHVALAQSVLTNAYLERESLEVLGRRALGVLEAGGRPVDGLWDAQLYRAMALGYTRAPGNLIEDAYREAMQLAPFRPVTHYTYALYLSQLRGRQADALAAIERALEIDPHYAEAKRLKARIELIR